MVFFHKEKSLLSWAAVEYRGLSTNYVVLKYNLVKQLAEKTATQKEYISIRENIKKGVESKRTCNKIAYNMTSKEQENGTRVQNIGETIEDKVPVETANIQARTKQQDNDIVTKKASNYQQQKEAIGNGQRNEIGEKPKYGDSERQDL